MAAGWESLTLEAVDDGVWREAARNLRSAGDMELGYKDAAYRENVHVVERRARFDG